MEKSGKKIKKENIIYRGNKKHRVLQWFYLNLTISIHNTEHNLNLSFFLNFFHFHEKGFTQLSKFWIERELGVLTHYLQKHQQTLWLNLVKHLGLSIISSVSWVVQMEQNRSDLWISWVFEDKNIYKGKGERMRFPNSNFTVIFLVNFI